MSEHCEFGDFLNDALCDKLVCGMNNSSIRKRLLTEKDLTFFFFPYGFFLLEKDIQDHGLAWKFSQDHDNPEIYNTKIQ